MLVSVLVMLLQAPPVPTFSAQVQVVGVTVNVVDTRTGKPVGGLPQSAFQVLEDGRRQEVVHFNQEDVPASVLVLLDTSVSMRELLPSVRAAAARLIRSLRPIDEVQVATFDDHYRLLCDFTTDREIAVRALEDVVEGEETALNRALYIATRYLEKRFPEQTDRRRVLILLSDGEDTYETLSYESTLDTLRRSGVVCYVVHLQRRISALPTEASLTLDARRFVEAVVYETGGSLAAVPYPYQAFDLNRAFTDIADELGSQYHLAYASSAGPGTGGWRAISVSMTSLSGVKLRFRRGYYVPSHR